MSAAAAAATAAATATASSHYTPPPPAPLPADYEAFLASLTPTERELMEMAKAKLGSSFFVQWCHAYRKWQKTKPKVAVAGASPL
jgi:hypothetical protein